MKGILKNKSKVVLLSLLFFAAFGQTTKAMNGNYLVSVLPHQGQPRGKALTLLKGTYSAVKGSCKFTKAAVAFPFVKTQEAGIHLGEGASHYVQAIQHLLSGLKESSHGVWNVAQLGVYFYALDILLKVAAPWIPTSMLPLALQDILTKIGTMVPPGTFSSWVNNLLSTRLFNSTIPATV